MNGPGRRRKIVVIPSWYPDPGAPLAGIFFQEQAKCLSRRFDVTVLTPRFPPLSELLRLNWGPLFLSRQDGSLSTCHVRKFKIPTLRRFLPLFSGPDHRLVYYRKFKSAIRRGFRDYVERHGLPDLIHAHVVLPAGWTAVELGKEFGVPVMVTEHTSPFVMHLATAKQRQLVRAIFGAATRVAAVSASLRQDIHAFLPELPIEISGNLIDTEFFTARPSLGAPGKQVTFFFLGMLSERKGVHFLLQAARMLRDRGLNHFELHLGGDGPYRPALEALAEQLDIRAHCRFLGFLDRAGALAEMQACDVFVLPSLAETFGIVVGEAMACGRPVLATRCGGPEDQVTAETGILVNPGNARELAEAMSRFMTEETSFEPDRIRSHIVRSFGPGAFLDRSEALYDSIIIKDRRLAG